MKNEISIRWKRVINIKEPMRQYFVYLQNQVINKLEKSNISIREQIKYQTKYFLFTNFKDHGILIDLDGSEYKQRFIKGFYWRTK